MVKVILHLLHHILAFICKETWLVGLDDYQIKKVSPIISHHVFHSFITAKRVNVKERWINNGTYTDWYVLDKEHP